MGRFRERSAYLLRLDCKKMSYLRLLKLLHIADREWLAETSELITGDRACAMKNGPVLPTVYDLIKGNGSKAGEWDDFIHTESVSVNGTRGLGHAPRKRAANHSPRSNSASWQSRSRDHRISGCRIYSRLGDSIASDPAGGARNTDPRRILVRRPTRPRPRHAPLPDPALELDERIVLPPAHRGTGREVRC